MRAQGLFKIGAVEVAVQVEDVHMVGLQTSKAGVYRAHHPTARVLRFIDTLRHFVAQLGGQHPVLALPLEQFAKHGLGSAARINIGRVHVVHALVARVGHYRGRLIAPSLVTKHHGAEAQCGNFQMAFA